MFVAEQGLLRSSLLGACGLYAVFCFTVLHISTSLAQGPTSPITPSGLTTQVGDPTSVAGRTQYNITGGTRAGTNLFHSFGAFSVPNNNIANFLNDTGAATTNILGRVTGGNGSIIFGTIQTTGFGHANLFLMNPAGMIFGQNASLNVGGSVTFTTADYLRLGDNGRFHTISSVTADTLLSTQPVTAYGFLGANPGAITFAGSHFKVSEGKSLSLVGGDITIRSTSISAPGGQINLVSVASPGEALAGTFTQTPNMNGVPFEALGTIQISQQSVVESSGNGGGAVRIHGGRFIIDDSRISANVTGLTTRQLTGPNIDIHLTQNAMIQPSAVLETNVAPDIASPSRGVLIEADRISIQGSPGSIEDFGRLPFTGIRSGTQGSGHAGNIILRSTGNIDITNVVNLESTSGFDVTGNPSRILAVGHAGNVEVISRHGNIQMIDGGGATIVTSQTGTSSGKTGTVSALAPEGDIVLDGGNLLTYSFPSSQGGGRVEINANSLYMISGLLSNDNESTVKPDGITVTLTEKLSMESGSLIVSSSVNDAPAGDITITAKDIVTTQGSIINNATFASGPGGQLKIVADTLQVTDGAQLSTGSTRAPRRGSLPQNIDPSGAGGDISIQTLGPRGATLIDGHGSGIFAETEGTGLGGSISLAAGKSISVSNGGVISASSTGSGNAGSISINAGQQLELTNGSSVKTTTDSAQANGGNITIQAIDRVRLVNKSEISTSVLGADGSGGNIFIDPKVVILEGSQVTAQAVGGAGGNITFVTPLFLADSASVVSASSQRGPSGTVTIQSPTSNLSSAVGQLVSKITPTQVLVQNRCVASTPGAQSTFILTGRDILPAEPGRWLSSPISMEHWTGVSPEHASTPMVQRRGSNAWPAKSAPKGETHILSLRRLTPPSFLVRTFASQFTGCSS